MLAMTERAVFIPDYDEWTPPEALFVALAEPGLKTKDKVEIVFAYYSRVHGGNGPTEREIAKVLGISHITVHQRLVDLVAEGRAIKMHGKYILQLSGYTHPSIPKILDASDD